MCETVAEARRLAFMGPERHKVVALDGTLIAKAGLITGGITGNEAARASRWDDHALNRLKAVRRHAAPVQLFRTLTLADLQLEQPHTHLPQGSRPPFYTTCCCQSLRAAMPRSLLRIRH